MVSFDTNSVKVRPRVLPVLGLPPVRDNSAVRRSNRDTLLRLVRANGPLARRQLVDILDLGSATVFNIVQELLDMGLLVEDSLAPSTGGRRPTLYSFNPNAFYTVGADVGGLGGLHLVLTDLDGRVVARRDDPFPAGPTPEYVVKCIVEAAEGVIADSGVARAKVGGIGVAMNGFIDLEHDVVVMDAQAVWDHVPLARMLQEAAGMPAYLVHQSGAVALAENWCGAGRTLNTFVTINIGLGVGVGMILNGRLYTGPTFKAGQLGHIVVDPAGPLCACGKHGCMQMLAGGEAVVRQVIQGLRLGATSSIVDRVRGDLAAVTARIVAEAAAAGDPFATQVVQSAGRYLGIGVSWLINLLNPQAVFVGGSIMGAGEILLDAIRGSVQALAMAEVANGVPVVELSLGADARSVGAAILVLERRLAL